MTTTNACLGPRKQQQQRQCSFARPRQVSCESAAQGGSKAGDCSISGGGCDGRPPLVGRPVAKISAPCERAGARKHVRANLRWGARAPSQQKQFLQFLQMQAQMPIRLQSNNKKDLSGTSCKAAANCKLNLHLLVLVLLPLVLALTLSAADGLNGKSGVRLTSVRGSKVRVLRQLAPHSGGQARRQADANVPYKTVHVTRACEWKSNLFVPKSNDVHFATPAADLDAGQRNRLPGPDQPPTVFDVTQLQAQQQVPSGGADDDISAANSRVFFTTDSRALVLALPIDFGPNFAGFEQACSIRLIVPKNMRILAKLSARRLSFAASDEQPPPWPPVLQLNPQPFQPASIYHQQHQQQQVQSEQHAATWLNVSQNALVENELKTLETGANVLAFRFLFERFANKLQPDIRFQVVLTAFQTLAENSDLNMNGGRPSGGGGGGQFGLTSPNSGIEQQFICDQQRLISANLACDGYKNCQDGSDEDPAICQALKDQLGDQARLPAPPVTITATTTTTKTALGGASDYSWAGLVEWDPDTISTMAGLLIGLIAVCMLLLCFVYFMYLCLIVWQRRWLGLGLGQDTSRADSSAATTASSAVKLNTSEETSSTLASSTGGRRRRLNRRERLAIALARATSASTNPARQLSMGEAAALARQNSENERRLRDIARSSAPAASDLGPAAPSIRPSRLQSILKRPQQSTKQPRPVEPPPAAPSRAGKRVGALASQLNEQQVQQLAFKPTPAQRFTRPTRPVPQPRPTGAARQPASPPSGASRGPRVTSYHYSGGSTQYTADYLERLAEEQHRQQASRGDQQQDSSGKLTSLI